MITVVQWIFRVTETSRVRPTVKEEIIVSGQGRRQSYDRIRVLSKIPWCDQDEALGITDDLV